MTVQWIDREKCIVCGRCFLICPMDVFGRVESHVFIAHPKECMTCYL
jgi:Fe-S-cluster-containing hydrogenase component 2